MITSWPRLTQCTAAGLLLSGQGELVLTEILAHGSSLSVPSGFDRILIADAQRHYVLAELAATSAHRIALPAGRYVVHGRRADGSYRAMVSLAHGERRALSASDLGVRANPPAAVKGIDPVAAEAITSSYAPAAVARRGAAVAVAGIVTRGAAEALPVLPGVQLTLQTASDGARSLGGALDLQLATGRATGFRESAAYLGVGAFVARARGGWRAAAGWRVSAGGVLQVIDGVGGTRWTLALGTGPWLAAAHALTPRLSLFVSAAIEARLMRGDGQLGSLWPTAALGAAWLL